MPVDDKLREFVQSFAQQLLPCEAVQAVWQADRLTIIAEKRNDVTLYCSRCGAIATPRGCANPGLIRHLNFEDFPVWIEVRFPRVFCQSHGHVLAKQTFCDPRCRASFLLEEALLAMVVASDRTSISIERQFHLPEHTISRIIKRARNQLRSSSLIASAPRSPSERF